MHLLGGKALFLSSDDIQLGTNETLKVRLLSLSLLNRQSLSVRAYKAVPMPA